METIFFFLFAGVSVLAAVAMVLFRNPIYSALSLVTTFFCLAGLFVLLNASFLAAVQVIVYAGAIMVLFLFVIMMLNLGEKGDKQERQWLKPGIWVGPAVLSVILLVELLVVISDVNGPVSVSAVSAKEVGLSLFGPYVLAVEIASMLLLAGLVGSFHLGRRYLERDHFEKGGGQ